MSYHASVTRNVNCVANINNALEFPVLQVSDTARVGKLDMGLLHAHTVTGDRISKATPTTRLSTSYFVYSFLVLPNISQQINSIHKLIKQGGYGLQIALLARNVFII